MIEELQATITTLQSEVAVKEQQLIECQESCQGNMKLKGTP